MDWIRRPCAERHLSSDNVYARPAARGAGFFRFDACDEKMAFTIARMVL